ncbi:gamma-glutamyl-gamma-aminobutyrate hydrolase family protein [Leekyejoonella antrihumi]|uniref:Gamma-glutamyl-gamma-aminobutyrate hydrolase family protein n=1 Tax=Leekyejoonella antrihumi TaxID=1660198 RepID=A0A563E0H3_9MICO|nr:gamma-glutamyl-gamma-aminobutyrate hydrolase family protein [Leekyejoonella antrihumi]TWP35672.1 gamma-glutamyl-gamma-aminobutyrate hydrolase family protein [Leekyejoonella antrihumi]
MSPHSEPAPVVGISTYRESARWGVWEVPADLLPTTYADAVRRAGGVPVLLPPVADPDDAARRVLPRLDGLIISGGADVDPARYGQAPGDHTTSWRDDRDAWELALLAAADECDVAMLGICRGMQVMVVHGGGTLQQHLPDAVHHDGHSPGGDVYGTTAVDVLPGSPLGALVGAQIRVRCHHHQSVAEHPGLEPAARAADGTLEAVHRADRPFWLGVQWHPEVCEDLGLFAGLVAAAMMVR